MKRGLRLGVMLVVIGCLGWMAAGQPMETGLIKQTVLLIVPASIHSWELAFVLRYFTDDEADVTVTQAGAATTSDLDGLVNKIPEELQNMALGPTTGPHVWVRTSASLSGQRFGKTLILGAGWYDEYFASSGYTKPTQPPYASDLYDALGQWLLEGTVVCTVGAGIYPLLFADLLPPGSLVPAYPCPDLIDVIDVSGYEPAQMAQTPRMDGRDWPPLVTVETYSVDVYDTKILMSPIPNSWYPLDETYGQLFGDDYGAEYNATLQEVENTYYTQTSPVIIESIDSGENGMVVLRNTSAVSVDLTGWRLQTIHPDTGEVQYSYPFENVVLEPGADVVVYYGMRMWDGPSNYYHWSEESPFGLGGGQVRLVDANGNQRARRTCP